MKLTKLDFAVILIVLFCLVGVVIIGFVSDPARQPPRVAYLYPAMAAVQNVWITEIDQPDKQRQLTFSEFGVYDFDFSPDGRRLAFAERTRETAITLRLLDIASGRVIDLVDCAALKAVCTTPAFSPDGAKLAYQRTESDNGRYGLPRIWLVDMTGPAYETVPLIADTQVIGHTAVWARNSSVIAFYSADARQPGILIFDFAPRGEDAAQLRFIPSSHGTMGALAPNGQAVIFPEIVRRDGQYFSHLRIADLLDKQFSAFTDPQGPTDDVAAQWSPDGETIAFARRYTDRRWTNGHQLYIRRLSDDDLRSIAYSKRYNTSYFRWNLAGSRLVMQRFPLLKADGTNNQDGRPEVWVHDFETGATFKIIEDAYLPQWAAQ